MFPQELQALKDVSSRLFVGVIKSEDLDYFLRIAKDLDSIIYAAAKNRFLK